MSDDSSAYCRNCSDPDRRIYLVKFYQIIDGVLNRIQACKKCAEYTATPVEPR